MITRYHAVTQIASIEERKTKVRKPGTSGVGGEAEMIDQPQGWFLVTTPPDPIALYVGHDQPEHRIGQAIHIIIEVDDEEA